MKKKKRTLTKKDVGKVFRWKVESSVSGVFWSGRYVVSSMKDNDLFLCHTEQRGSHLGRAYLYKSNRKNKWVLGEVRPLVGYWEELTPLEVLILCGNNLPRKYRRKQFK